MSGTTGTGPATDSLTLIDNLIIGQKLGNCLIEGRIGKGGMATVYRAIRDEDEVEVAVKVISHDITNTVDFIERFKREGRLMQSLQHQHILPVYEFGTSGELMYIIMKLIEGGSLDTMLSKGRLPLELSLQLLEQIASALQYAHDKGIIHRDLKPGNVLLDLEGNAYLTDFGIAKWKEETAGLTLTGMVMGTPGYMSPEQWRTEPVDQRTDVYALGVMTFKMLTGRLPFHADTPFSLMYKHLDEAPPLAAEYVPSLVPSIDQVLQRSMAKLPEKRYPSTTHFLAALKDAVENVRADVDVVADSDDATALMTDSIALQGMSNAIDVGARGIVNRIREAIRESAGETLTLAKALLDYTNELRQRANQQPDLIQGPYKALESYDLADNKLFFGREAAIDSMLDRAPFSKFTVLHAESGAGKTSLIRAGIMPRLLAGGYLPLYVAVRLYPPHVALKSLLLHDDPTKATLAPQKGTLRNFLRQIATIIGQNREIFIFVDQFETLFTDVFDEEARTTFVREIADCIDDESLQIRVVLAMRTEYFGMVASFQPAIAQPFSHEFLLRRLTHDEARQALAMPAEAQSYTFEDGLIEEILSDLSDENNAIAPPQLQLVGTALIERLPTDRTVINFTDYDSAGRAKGVLGSYLQRILDKLPNTQRKTARLVIESLVRPNQTRDVKTRKQLYNELDSIGQDSSKLDTILHGLRESHVLRLLETNDGAAYELVHDYLATQIQIDAETATRKAAQELLQRRLDDYQQFESLLTQAELNVIRPHFDSIYISPEARNLITTSEQVLSQQRRRARQLIGTAILGMIGALLIGVILLVRESENQREQAELLGVAATENAESQLQESRRLAEQVFTYLELDPMVALNLAIEALTPRGRPVVGSAELALSAAIQHVDEEVYVQSDAQPLGAHWLEDANRLLLWGADQRLRLLDATSGVEYTAFDTHAGSLLAGDVAPNGEILLGDSSGALYRYQYDPAEDTLNLVDEIPTAHTENISEIVWATEGGYFLVEAQESLGFGNGESGVWELDGTQRFRLPGINPALSPDASLITIHYHNTEAAPNGSVGIVEAESGERLVTFSVPEQQLQYSIWLDSDHIASWGNETPVYIWRVMDGEQLTTLSTAVKSIELEDRSGNDHVAVSTDGQSIAVVLANSNMARVWNTQSGIERFEVSTAEAIRGVEWSPTNNSVLLIYTTNAAEIWIDGVELPTVPLFDDILRDNESIIRGGWSPSGNFAYVWTDNPVPEQPSRILVWEAETGSLVADLVGHTEQLRQLSWSVDETSLLTVGGRDNSTRIWRVIAGDEQTQFSEINRLIYSNAYPTTARWSNDETLIATGYADGTVMVWDSMSAIPIFSQTGHQAAADTLAWSHDNASLASASDDGTVIVWDAQSGERMFEAEHTMDGNRFEINVLLWQSNSQQLVTGGDDGFIRLWDIQTGEVIHELQQTDSAGINVSALVWNTDESILLASGDDGSVTLWDIANGDVVLDIFTDMLVTFGVRWNRDESQILVWGDGLFTDAVAVYDTRTGERVYELSGHSNPVTSAVWSPDESQIVTASQDQTMRVWNLNSADENGRILEASSIYDVFGDTVYGLQWDVNGRLLAVDRSPSIRIWNLADGVELFRASPDRNLRLEDIQWNDSGDRILLATRNLITDEGSTRVLTTQTDIDELLDLALTLRTRPLTNQQRLQLLGE